MDGKNRSLIKICDGPSQTFEGQFRIRMNCSKIVQEGIFSNISLLEHPNSLQQQISDPFSQLPGCGMSVGHDKNIPDLNFGLEYSSQVKCRNRPRFASARSRFHQIHSGERHREDIQRWRRHQRITTRFACSGPRIREASCSNSPSKISMPLSRKASWL